jgi:plastocyanin
MRTTRVALAVIGAALALPGTAVAATYKVSAGAPANAKMPGSFAAGLYDADAFYPGTHKTLKIHKGDRVNFSGGFHTATILGSTSRADLEIIQPDPAHGTYGSVLDANATPFYWNGLAKFVYNGATFAPAGATTVTSKTALYHSGILGQFPNGYTLKFNRTGTFTIVCAIHPGMKGTVDVLAKSKSVPSAKSDAARARDQLNKGLSTLKKLDKQKVTAANTIVAGPDKGAAVLYRFTPNALTTKVNTPVTMEMSAGTTEDHTFTFAKDIKAAGKQSEAELVAPLPGTGTSGPPILAFSPKWAYPSEKPGTDVTYDGTNHGDGFLNSGVLDGSSKTLFPQKFSVSFTKPGTYSFFCAIHPFMTGKVTVTS